MTDADRAAGVVRDRVGRLAGSDRRVPPDFPVREVLVTYTARDGTVKTLRLLSDLLDVPASVVAELYRHRWQIELFFRWLKVHASFEHLTSHSRNGITPGFYVAVIAAMLLCLHTQKPLSKYGYNLLVPRARPRSRWLPRAWAPSSTCCRSWRTASASGNATANARRRSGPRKNGLEAAGPSRARAGGRGRRTRRIPAGLRLPVPAATPLKTPPKVRGKPHGGPGQYWALPAEPCPFQNIFRTAKRRIYDP